MDQRHEVRKADSLARHSAFWLIVAAAAFGALVLAGVFGKGNEPPEWLVERLSQPGSAQGTLLAAAVIAMVPVLVMACYLFLAGSRTVRSGRYPPPGLAVWRDTRAIEGRPAIRRGRMLVAIAVALIGLALLVPVLMWQLVRVMALAS